MVDAKERRCPVCGEGTKESEIRRNRSLEEVSEAWLEARWVREELVRK